MSEQSTRTLIRLLRHGEPLGGRRYRGCTDDPLSATGWEQMRAAVGADEAFQSIVSSPLLRCHAYAQQLADQRGLPLRVDERLREMSYGEWEGLTPQAIDQRWPGARAAYRAAPQAHLPPGAESFDGFVQRVAAGWDALAAGHASQSVLLVTHAGVIRALFAQLLEMPRAAMFRLAIPYAGGCRVSLPGQASAAPMPARVELA